MGLDPRRDFGRFWWAAPVLVAAALGLHWVLHVPTSEMQPRPPTGAKGKAGKKKPPKKKRPHDRPPYTTPKKPAPKKPATG